MTLCNYFDKINYQIKENLSSMQNIIQDSIEIISREKNLPADIIQDIIEKSVTQVIQDSFYIEEVKVKFEEGEIKTYVKENDEFVEKKIVGQTDQRTTMTKIIKNIRYQIAQIEKQKEIEFFQDKINTIMIGKIQEINVKGIIVQINGFSTLMPRALSHPLDKSLFNINQKIQVLIHEIDEESKVYNTIVSRNSAEFISKLLESEIPEIYDNIIQIHNVVRIAGKKSKVAVFCPEQNLNPIIACLGVNGSRIKAIRKEVHNEIIDIIEYTTNYEQYVLNSLNPARPIEIIEEAKNKYTAIVKDDDIRIALGKFMSNVELAQKLTNSEINVLSETEYQDQFKEVQNSLIQYLMSNLEIDDMTARLLITCGFKDLENIASSSIEEIERNALSGYRIEEIEKIHKKAIENLVNKEQGVLERLEELGLSQEIIDLIPLENKEIYIKLAEAGVKTIEDLLFVKKETLIQILSETDVTESEVNEMLQEAQQMQKRDSKI